MGADRNWQGGLVVLVAKNWSGRTDFGGGAIVSLHFDRGFEKSGGNFRQ